MGWHFRGNSNDIYSRMSHRLHLHRQFVMTLDHSAPLTVGAVSAVLSAVVQDGASTPSLGSLLVPALSAIVGAVSSYAVLKTTVKTVERDVGFMRKDIMQINETISDTSVRLARIEGRLERE